MPKKEKSMKNSARKGGNIEKRVLLEKDEDGQEYGIVEKELGKCIFYC